MAIHSAQKKGVGQAIKPNDWTEDLFSAVGQVLPEWVNSYRLFSEDKVEAGTLNFRDTAKALRTAAAHQAVTKHQAVTSRPTKFTEGSFEPSSEGEEAQFLVEDTLESDNEELTNQRKRRRYKSTKDSECSATSDQENQSSPPPKRRKCHGCGGNHFYRRCFYLFPTLAPEYWVPRAEIVKMVKKALNEDEDFAEEIRKLRLVEEKKRKEN
jgi:hypothetical protein